MKQKKPSKKNEKQESLNRLNDQLLIAKSENNSKLIKSLEAIITCLKDKKSWVK